MVDMIVYPIPEKNVLKCEGTKRVTNQGYLCE